MRVSKSIPVVLVLAAAWSCAQAAADFTTIRRSTADLNDSTPQLLVNFTMPSTVNRSSSTANSAVLDVEINQAEYNYNRVYINPPTTVCTDQDTDANASASIGYLQEHDDINLKTEWATNHFVFSSALLKSGSNTLMICIRSETGGVGTGAGNLDDVSVRGMVLHYHTS